MKLSYEVPLSKTWHIAKSYAQSKGEDNNADDFAQDVALALFQGRKATIKQMFVDYLRVKYGRSGRGKDVGIKNRTHIGSEHLMKLQDSVTFESTLEFRSMLRKFSKKLVGKDKTVFLLYFFYGMSTPEIAIVLSHTNSGISIRLKNVLAVIKIDEKFRRIK